MASKTKKQAPSAATFDKQLAPRIAALARNLWWTWNPPAQRLFAALDPQLWATTNHNPLQTLAGLPDERKRALAGDANFARQLDHCEDDLRTYLRAKPWFAHTARPSQKRMLVAYFCAEFGIHESLPQYAGGLGVLAGDHLKSASDLGIPLVAVGLLYRCGYYRQELDADGATRVVYPEHDFTQLPIEDTRKTIRVNLGRRSLHARIWRAAVGRVNLYLLDTDIKANKPKDRALTRHLYGGDQEMRIQQEILLGIGGLRALEALDIKPTVFHLNEGHAAFCALDRLRQNLKRGDSPQRALANVRQTTVFTTHTPVPAGHDRFPPQLMRKYFPGFEADCDWKRGQLLELGRENPRNRDEPFCMTVLALNLSSHCNSVSKLHGEVSRQMWYKLYNLDNPDAAPIGHVTNGIHVQTWLAPEITPLYDKYLRPRWVGAGPEYDWWQKVDRIPSIELWRARCALRTRLINFIRQRLRDQLQRRCAPPDQRLAAEQLFSENALTIGFARRFATYKRAPLIFRDAKRLKRILNQTDRPVQLVFAGKAHPLDNAGQTLAQQIHRFARQAGFRGRVVLLEDYDMHVGRMLTSGCDLWLNNPLRPQEASGTSGMKPPLHGGLNCSILDGWWPEAFDGRNGWAIDTQPQRTRSAQDRRDAQTIYDLLENEIVPAFYDRDKQGVPRAWVRRIIAGMKTICAQFSTHRMLADYTQQYYLPAHAEHRAR